MSTTPHQPRWWSHPRTQVAVVLGTSAALWWIAVTTDDPDIARTCIVADIAICALTLIAGLARARTQREHLHQELRGELHDTVREVLAAACGTRSDAERVRAIVQARYDQHVRIGIERDQRSRHPAE